MKFKEQDKIAIKVSDVKSVTGEVVYVSRTPDTYYVSAGEYSGFYEEHELSPLYPLQKGVTYFNVAPGADHLGDGTEMLADQAALHMAQYKTFAEEVEAWAKVTDAVASESTKATTGSLRFNTGKVQTREIDPSFILGIGEVLTKSREKYPEMNWALPTKLSTPYESLQRHLLKFWSGEDFDKDSGKHHLLHVATNVMFLYYHVMNSPEGDDRAFKKKEKK